MVQQRTRALKAPVPARRAVPPQRSPRVQAKHDRRRDQVLHAALLAFRDRGYHDTTLDHIAKRLGVRKTALYHYFPDKEAILYACHQESLAELARILAEAKKLPTAAGQLRHVVKEHVRVMVETLEGSPLAFEVAAMSPARQRQIIAARDRYERALRRMIERGMKERAFRKVDSKIAVFAILGAINWIARWYRPEGRLHAPELGAQFADHLVGGLARTGGAA
jgi:TetR/AcrR family transcriptional regulator